MIGLDAGGVVHQLAVVDPVVDLVDTLDARPAVCGRALAVELTEQRPQPDDELCPTCWAEP